jgi:hypothetical protein
LEAGGVSSFEHAPIRPKSSDVTAPTKRSPRMGAGSHAMNGAHNACARLDIVRWMSK